MTAAVPSEIECARARRCIEAMLEQMRAIGTVTITLDLDYAAFVRFEPHDMTPVEDGCWSRVVEPVELWCDPLALIVPQLREREHRERSQ